MDNFLDWAKQSLKNSFTPIHQHICQNQLCSQPTIFNQNLFDTTSKLSLIFLFIIFLKGMLKDTTMWYDHHHG
jgi:hypothetical protein